MKLETPFIALGLVSIIFMGLFTAFTTLAEHNDISLSTSLYSTDNKSTSLNAAFAQINETKTNMEAVTYDFEHLELKDTGSLFAFFKLAKDIGSQMFNSLDLLKTLVFSAAQIVGIPPIIVGTLFAMLLVSFVVMVILILLGNTV